MSGGELIRIRETREDELVWVTLKPEDPQQGQVFGKLFDGQFELPERFLLPSGTTMHFTAIPETGYVFELWSDGVKENPQTLSPDSETFIVAKFRLENPMVPRIVSAPETITVRRGEEIEIEVVVEGDSPLSFQWYDADNRPIPGAIGPILKTVVGTERYFSGALLCSFVTPFQKPKSPSAKSEFIFAPTPTVPFSLSRFA